MNDDDDDGDDGNDDDDGDDDDDGGGDGDDGGGDDDDDDGDIIQKVSWPGHYADIFIDTPKKSTQSMMNGRLPDNWTLTFLSFSLPIIYSLLHNSSILLFIFWPRAGSSVVGE